MSFGELQRERTIAVSGQGRSTLLPLLTHYLRMQARAALIWGVYLGAIGALYVWLFPAIADHQKSLTDVVDQLPRSVRQMFGFGEGSGFGTVEGFLSTEMLSFIAPLALAFYPILNSASAIAGAEEDRRLDVLMSNPLPRWQLVVGNILATALSLLGILAVIGLLIWVAAVVTGVDLPAATVVSAVLNIWPLAMLFGGLAMLCSAVFRRRVTAIAVPAVVLVIGYALNAAGDSVSALAGVRRLSPFDYYGPAIIEGLDWASFGLLTLIAAVLVVLAVLAFQRRDIYT